MTEPKFLRKPTPPKVQALAVKEKARKKQVKPAAKALKAPPPPSRTPLEALADLSGEWKAADAARLAGTPPSSPTSALILKHLERADLPVVVDAPFTMIGEEEPEDATSASQDALISLHRRDLASTRSIVMRLIAELDFVTEHMTLLDTVADFLAKPDDAGAELMRREFHKISSYPSRVGLAKTLSDTLKALVPLERQAAGLADGYVDAATERARKETATVATVVATSFETINGKFSQIMAKFQQKAI